MDSCKYEGVEKVNDTTDMISCCLCAGWFHTECVGLNKNDSDGVWPCLTCRNMFKEIQKVVSSMEVHKIAIEAISKTNTYLQNSLEQYKNDLKSKTLECDKLKEELSDLRTKVGIYKAEADKNTWKKFQNKKTLLIGDSLLQDVDENKLLNTKVSAVPGAKIKDIAQKLQNVVESDASYSNVVLCMGTNDCSDPAMDVNAASFTYKELVSDLTTNKGIEASSIVISSVPPRNDDHGSQQRVDSLNAALTTVAVDVGAIH